jgi:hypothetical protein
LRKHIHRASVRKGCIYNQILDYSACALYLSGVISIRNEKDSKGNQSKPERNCCQFSIIITNAKDNELSMREGLFWLTVLKGPVHD